MCVSVCARAFNVYNTPLDLLLQQIAPVVFVFFGSEGDEERKIEKKKRDAGTDEYGRDFRNRCFLGHSARFHSNRPRRTNRASE